MIGARRWGGGFMSDDVGQEVLDAELVQPTPFPAKPRVWTVFLAIVLATVVNIGVSVIVVVLLIGNAVSEGMSAKKAAEDLPAMLMAPVAFMLFIAVGGLAYATGAIIPARLSPTPWRERLGLSGKRVPARVYLLAMLGSLAPLALALGLAQALTLLIPPDESLQMLFDRLTLATAVPFVLSIAIVPGISEELMFRGYVQRRLLQRWSPAWAIGVTSLIFALVHVQPHTVAAAFPLGLWLGFLAWKCGSIGPSILCHAFINGSLNAWRVIVKFGEVPETAQTVVEVGSVLVGLVCLVLLLRLLSGAEKEPAELSSEVAVPVDEQA